MFINNYEITIMKELLVGREGLTKEMTFVWTLRKSICVYYLSWFLSSLFLSNELL